MPYNDLTGKVAGRLTAQWPIGLNRNRQTLWLCLCACGNTHICSVVHFGKGTNSCGCYRREVALAKIRHTHTGRTRDRQKWEMLQSAKNHSKAAGIPFNIDLIDLDIPARCPLLGIRIRRGKGKAARHSPSLDRIIPSLGYVRGNIQVISWRANALKKDASLEEMKLLVKNWEAIESAKKERK